MIKAIILVISLGLSTGFAESLQITSHQLRGLVESRNERVQAKELERMSSQLKEGSLVRSYLPIVEIYGAQETFKLGSQESKIQPTYGAEVKVNLYNGGQDSLQESQNKLTTRRKSYEKAITITEQLLQTYTVYWDILFLQDYLNLIQQAHDMNSNNLKSANRRIRSGVATESDRIEFEMKEVELRQLKAEIDLKHNSQIQKLKLLLGFDEKIELRFSAESAHEHDWVSKIHHSEEDHEYLVKPLQILSEELKLESTTLQRSYWPKLEAYAAYNQYNEREEEFSSASDRKETVVGLRMTLHLFDGLKSSRQSHSMLAQAKATKLEAQYKKRELDLHLHTEISELHFLHGQVHEAEENIKRSEKYYRMTQSEYSRGVKNSPDVLGASEKLLHTQVNRLEITRRFQTLKSHLLAKLGK